VVIDVEKNPKKQQKILSTGDAESPVPLSMETTIPPYSRKTRSSRANASMFNHLYLDYRL
jgi:hypothetical protein